MLCFLLEKDYASLADKYVGSRRFGTSTPSVCKSNRLRAADAAAFPP